MLRMAGLVLAFIELAGCVSGQLNFNTLDLASTTDSLLTEQIIENLARFIDTSTAVPAQIVMNGGTTTTANTVTPQFTDPLSRAVTIGSTVATAATTTTTNSLSSVANSKSATISASNVATQNWAFEPIIDPDQLRRLYDLYRFAVAGNDEVWAQKQLIQDYPLSMKTTTPTGGGPSTTSVDETALSGPNCVVCNANKPPIGLKCDSYESKPYYRPDAPGLCLRLNPRLLPRGNNGPWLRWTNLAGARPFDAGRQPETNDYFIGERGRFRLYVDADQGDRYAEFALLVAAAADSAPNPSSGASSAGGSAPKAKGAIATPNAILLGQ